MRDDGGGGFVVFDVTSNGIRVNARSSLDLVDGGTVVMDEPRRRVEVVVYVNVDVVEDDTDAVSDW